MLRKIDDRITLGLATGFLASLVKLTCNELLFRKGVEKKRFGEIVSGVFMPAKVAETKSGILFGTAGDMAISTVFGIPMAYVLSVTGKDKPSLKGLTLGFVLFGTLRGVLANVGPGKTYPKDPISNATMSLSSGLWGLVAGITAVKLGKSSLFPDQGFPGNQEPPIVDRKPLSPEYAKELSRRPS